MNADLEEVAPTARDRGFTIAELLVAMGLFSVLGTVLLGFVLGTARVTDEVDMTAELTGDARLALERMSRELRQAREVEAATVSAGTVAVTVWTDFDGDGNRDLNAADPEVLTYRWTSGTGLLTLTVNDASGESVTAPVMATKVVEMDLQLRSSLWQYDGADGSTRDGTTTWQELDAAGSPVGNHNAAPDVELTHVDLIALRIKLTDDGTTREFLMQADLRNQRVG